MESLPYASGSLCVESPMQIIFRRGSQPLIFLILLILYFSVPSVRLDNKPDIVIQLASRRISCPCG